MTEKGFVKANSSNLPKVDMFMVAQFMKNNTDFISAEVRGVKIKRAGRESYGDSAIGYVQLMRDGPICSVKAKISPEHRMHSKAYVVEAVINEDDDLVQNIMCHDCAASLGGCKHSVALLMWLHRRTEEAAPTSVDCYWKKSKLSDVGKVTKFIPASEMGRQLPPLQNTLPVFLTDLTSKLKSANASSQILQHIFPNDKIHSLSLHTLSLKFLDENRGSTADDFFLFCIEHMTEQLCLDAYLRTTDQSKSALWYDLRYGRITASKIHEAAHCKVCDGALVEAILGASKIKETPQMRRGKDLEKQVIDVVSKERNIKIEPVGLLLNSKYPIFGASPDGTTCDAVIEIKCPSNDKAIRSYISEDGTVMKKYLAQIQLQMLFSNKTSGKFCVASPSFEKDRKVTIIDVVFDKDLCDYLIEKSLVFWKKAIAPILLKKN